MQEEKYFRIATNLLRFRKLDLLGRLLPIPTREAIALFILLRPCQAGCTSSAVRISDLTECLDISAPACSAIVRRMEARGLVRRRPDAADRRICYLELTDAGREMALQCSGVLADTADQMFAIIGRSRLEQLTDLSEELCTAAETVLHTNQKTHTE